MRKDEKAQMGQTIRTESGPDRSTYKMPGDESVMGRKMRGGVDNLDHSITGAKSTVHLHKNATGRGKSPM
jgi:hypothetical protein